MNNTPFYYISVWHSTPKTVIGNILEYRDYQQLLNDGARLYSFAGRLATVCVVTKDSAITRLQALDFATMFMRGKYVTISVDLNNLTSTTTNGQPPP